MDSLLLFYRNPSEREAVKAFMIETLAQMAVDKAFNREDVNGIADARDLIDKTFQKLGEKYGKIEEPVIHNSR